MKKKAQTKHLHINEKIATTKINAHSFAIGNAHEQIQFENIIDFCCLVFCQTFELRLGYYSVICGFHWTRNRHICRLVKSLFFLFYRSLQLIENCVRKKRQNVGNIFECARPQRNCRFHFKNFNIGAHTTTAWLFPWSTKHKTTVAIA